MRLTTENQRKFNAENITKDIFQIHSTAWYSWVECCSVSLYIKIWRSVGYCANQCPVSWRTVKVSERHSEKQSMYS